MVRTVKLAFNIAAPLFLMGCAQWLYTPQDLRSANRAHLSSLHPGITRDEATKLMGTEGKSRCLRENRLGICMSSEVVSNPYRATGVQNEGRTYEILYYWTDVKPQDGTITDDELTPLIFENGKLIGWGQDVFSSTVKKIDLGPR